MNLTRASESVGTPLQSAGRYRQKRMVRRTALSSLGPPLSRMKALWTCPSVPTMKLTRTRRSSSSGWSNGSGVSKASGGRTLPHFGRARGSDTGENSEICAGTRRRDFSSSVSGERCGTMVEDGRDPQAKATPRAASDMAAAIASLEVLQLGQTHRITGVRAIQPPECAGHNNRYFNRLWDIIRPILQPRCNRLQLRRSALLLWQQAGRAGTPGSPYSFSFRLLSDF